MTATVPVMRLQTPDDAAEITVLHEKVFGPGRFSRTAYRVREGSSADVRLNVCIAIGARLAGAVQFTPISIGGKTGAVLLGPLAIHDAYRDRGFGLKLMLDGLERAKACGYRIAILVGDPPYYARAGFFPVPYGAIVMPGPVDTSRLLRAELDRGAAGDFHGRVSAA